MYRELAVKRILWFTEVLPNVQVNNLEGTSRVNASVSKTVEEAVTENWEGGKDE